jgi:hypothetical protein
MQMIGRGLRTFPGKTECIILDHVGNLQEHGHPLQAQDWQFDGRERRQRAKTNNSAVLRLCAEIDYMYCDKPTCAGCQYNTTGRTTRNVETVETDLVEAATPLKGLYDRPPEERAEIVERINAAKIRAHEDIVPEAIGEMLEIAQELGRNPLWVYWELSKNRATVNVPLLAEIARQKQYKPKWAWFQTKLIRQKLAS